MPRKKLKENEALSHHRLGHRARRRRDLGHACERQPHARAYTAATTAAARARTAIGWCAPKVESALAGPRSRKRKGLRTGRSPLMTDHPTALI